jgi:glutathione synthase/RimK-type ligase-like ATP-grasp enzyme
MKLKIFNIKKNDPWNKSKYNIEYQSLLKKYPYNKLPMLIENDIKIAYLSSKDFTPLEHEYLKFAIQDTGLSISYIDANKKDSINHVLNGKFDGIIIRPSHKSNYSRSIFYDLAWVIRANTQALVWPNETEDSIYENKLRLSEFLNVNAIPCPVTNVFFELSESLEYLKMTKYPIILKSSVGSASSGVYKVDNRKRAEFLVRLAFSLGIPKKGISCIGEREKGYVIIQEFLENVKEYRVIKIGDSWFGHEKRKQDKGTFHSGSGVNAWTPPTKDLLNFCSNLAEKYNFNCICFDIFQQYNGPFLVNELQTWFGSYNPSQMYIDGVPGRYRRIGKDFLFEEGLFNRNGGYNLRLEEFSKEILKRKGLV